MSGNQSHEAKRFQLLSSVGQIGWWEADFATGEYLCSEYVCNLLGLEGDTLTFRQFGQLIREDYRCRITREFLSSKLFLFTLHKALCGFVPVWVKSG